MQGLCCASYATKESTFGSFHCSPRVQVTLTGSSAPKLRTNRLVHTPYPSSSPPPQPRLPALRLKAQLIEP